MADQSAPEKNKPPAEIFDPPLDLNRLPTFDDYRPSYDLRELARELAAARRYAEYLDEVEALKLLFEDDEGDDDGGAED